MQPVPAAAAARAKLRIEFDYPKNVVNDCVVRSGLPTGTSWYPHSVGVQRKLHRTYSEHPYSEGREAWALRLRRGEPALIVVARPGRLLLGPGRRLTPRRGTKLPAGFEWAFRRHDPGPGRPRPLR
jgi:hypothetical protein